MREAYTVENEMPQICKMTMAQTVATYWFCQGS